MLNCCCNYPANATVLSDTDCRDDQRRVHTDGSRWFVKCSQYKCSGGNITEVTEPCPPAPSEKCKAIYLTGECFGRDVVISGLGHHWRIQRAGWGGGVKFWPRVFNLPAFLTFSADLGHFSLKLKIFGILIL